MNVLDPPAPELSPAQRAELVASLHARHALLAEQVQHRLHGADGEQHDEAGLPRRGLDTDDDATAEAQRHEDIAHLARAADELAALEQALQRVADGSYGACIDCGDPIGLARLQAQPAAPRCAGCQGYVEQHAPRHR